MQHIVYNKGMSARHYTKCAIGQFIKKCWPRYMPSVQEMNNAPFKHDRKIKEIKLQ